MGTSMGKRGTVIKIYCKSEETRKELKKIVAEFGTYEKALIAFIKVYRRSPFLFQAELPEKVKFA